MRNERRAPRAYYAAFWHCRDLVEERLGPLDTTGAEVHRAVAAAIAMWDEETAKSLVQLRVVRNRADYDTVTVVAATLTIRSLGAAREILEAG